MLLHMLMSEFGTFLPSPVRPITATPLKADTRHDLRLGVVGDHHRRLDRHLHDAIVVLHLRYMQFGHTVCGRLPREPSWTRVGGRAIRARSF